MDSIHNVDALKKAASRNRNFQPIPSSSVPPQSHVKDPFYGYEYIARLCARFITHLFACPEYPPTSTQSQAKLPHFIAYAFHRTKLHESVTFAALALLQRLKARFPTARGSSGHRLFISAFMIASKVICDDTYSNKSWSIVAQGMFTLREINQMEREMCNYLDWELTVDNPILADFTTMVKEDFSSSQGPYPTYPLKVVSKRAAKAASTSTKSTPVPEHNSTTSPIPIGHPSSPRKPPQSLVPPRKGSPTIDMSPDTPASSYSDTTSPATSSSPQTPIGDEDFSAKIRDNDYPLGFSITEKHMGAALKSKTFAFAVPAIW
ncbi:hypothetical protein EV368DRAFT_77536 [Lentinula lateritia]|uniref:Uncharacterized protein n=1 Tax=Lentinula aff. lateritia TaxID=2804960 RepID=A0ACC1UGH8_9AGAR|nr:hypothetical protein F5876DRAFT_61188 [Lentinula aff. lateritia]KAJ3857629.1 hypothetical protein EV368DRAFT_77536 [Lentinula lateritia]